MDHSQPNAQTRLFITLLLTCSLLSCLPFFFARFIPSTDLPQHLAQIRLLEDVLRDPQQQAYAIDWFGANTLVYYLLWIDWKIFTPILAGKILLVEIVLSWVVSIFTLARHKNRPTISAAIACVFLFNASLYWGFLNFLIGFPVFVVWYILIVDPRNKRTSLVDSALIVLTSFLLFFAHTLWLLIGLLYLGVKTIRQRPSVREIGVRSLALAPVGIYSILWFPRLSAIRDALGFDTAAHWFISPYERLDPRWLVNSMLGGLHGPTEAIILAVIIIWIGLSVRTNWGLLSKTVDKEFLAISIVLGLVVILAPDKYINTMMFASRWAPIAMIFFLLSLPVPRIPEPIVVVSALLLVAVLSSTTGFFWSRFERSENSGLEESLNAVPDNSRVLGLDFVAFSQLICGRPFVQTFSYAQVLHGGRLNFSFAEHHSGIVSFTETNAATRWTSNLEWSAYQVRFEDFYQFDYALIHGREPIQRYAASLPMLKPVTTHGLWRLWRCLKDTASTGQTN